MTWLTTPKVPAWTGPTTVHRIRDDALMEPPKIRRTRGQSKPWALLTPESTPLTLAEIAMCWPLIGDTRALLPAR